MRLKRRTRKAWALVLCASVMLTFGLPVNNMTSKASTDTNSNSTNESEASSVGTSTDNTNEVLSSASKSTKKSSTSTATKKETVDEIIFSQGSGDYQNNFNLSITETTPASGDVIYYTTDGSNPSTSSTRKEYTEPLEITDRSNEPNYVSAVDTILFDSVNLTVNSSGKGFVSTISTPSAAEVDKSTVVKAVKMNSDGTYGEVYTNTYFVGAMEDHIKGIKESCEAAGVDLSIMSISVDYDDLFDSTKGIYVKGDVFDNALKSYLDGGGTINSYNAVDTARKLDANYKQKGNAWERAAHIDYFESDGSSMECKLQQDCGIRIQGNYSRSDLQKGLRLYARADYGQKNFKYEFFGNDAVDDSGKTISKFKKLTLRNGGNCAFTTKFSDAYWQSLIKELKVETQASRVCVVYLDGEYWGLYILQEDYTDDFMEEEHGVNKDDVVIYKGDAEALEIGYKLDEGSLPEGVTDESYYFNDLFTFFNTHSNLCSEEDYAEFCKLVDPDSIRDYFAINVWLNNKWDWPGKNWSAWRTINTDATNEYADGRWRLCCYDLDFGGVSGYSDISTNTISEDNLFSKSSKNPIVKMFRYLMSNETFKNEFNEELTNMSTGTFAYETAQANLEKYKNTYSPLYDQFFARYGTGSADNALYGSYASYSCIATFIKSRKNTISTIVKYVNSYYKKNYGGTTATSTPVVTVAPTETASVAAVVTASATTAPVAPVTTKATPSPKKITKLSVNAKKGKKKIVVSTLKKAKITVTINKKIIIKNDTKKKTITINASANKSGKTSVKLSSKLKKGMKITIIVSKSGYVTRKKIIKI